MNRKIEIGYVPVNLRASAAAPSPRLLRAGRERPLGRRAVQACPAVNTLERRIIEVLAPFSLGLQCSKNHRGGYDLYLDEGATRLDDDLLGEFVTLMPRDTWRSENRPVVQIGLPHIFVCDDECFLTQMPPWASSDAVQYPGQFIGGRFPTHMWPRSLNLSFEWSNLAQGFRMKRGQPVCYLFVEPENPNLDVDLVAARMTEELGEYRTRIEDVVKFTSGSFELIDSMSKFRPAQLMTKVET